MVLPSRFPSIQNERVRALMLEYAESCPQLAKLEPHFAMLLKLHVAFARYEKELNNEKTPIRKVEKALSALIKSLDALPNTYEGMFDAIGAQDKLDAMMRLSVVQRKLEAHHCQQPFARPRGPGRRPLKQADDLICALASLSDNPIKSRENGENTLNDDFVKLLDKVFDAVPKKLKPKDVHDRALELADHILRESSDRLTGLARVDVSISQHSTKPSKE